MVWYITDLFEHKFRLDDEKLLEWQSMTYSEIMKAL